MPPKMKRDLNINTGRLSRQPSPYLTPDGDPFGDVIGPESRTPSGMIQYMGQGASLTKSRSMSAPPTPFSTSRVMSNWADEMDYQDAKMQEQEAVDAFERIQTGLATDYPELPQGCWMDQNLRSDWHVDEPQTRTMEATVEPFGRSEKTEQVVYAINPYGFGAESKTAWVKDAVFQMPELSPADELKESTIRLLEDDKINPFKGSVPLEKIQNILSCNRGPYTDLYHVVVGKGKGKLKAFLQQYPDTFQHFAIEDGKWRLRLTKHTNYEFADREERRVREREVKHFLDALQMYLEKQPSRCCKVDDFIAAYPHLSINKVLATGELEHKLPPRGDLVRFVEKHTSLFRYEKSHKMFIIRLI
uniref:Uncharacterized protein n=1 Tax=Eutreptiella gymnastica TaxID=73025 RepID=A0A7S4CZA9_9EUGL